MEKSGSVDLDAQRDELEVVLRSKYFMRAPILAHLLSYLCQKLFAGEANQVKEYSVGVEVFDRGPDFDQNSDSIVRVEANRLRKRLAEYYATEGASHQLQIAIPLGQYVPEFKRIATEECKAAQTSEASPSARQTTAPGLEKRTFRFRVTPAWWFSIAIVLLLIGASITLLQRSHKPSPQSVASDQTAAPQIEPQVGPPIGQEVRILAGSGRGFVDHAGKLWSADAWFAGGTAVKNSVQHIWRTQDLDFYRTSRQGQFQYAIPLKKAIYELRLHFAETVYGPESTGTGGEGSRLITVRVNGKTLVSRFDIVADAGGSRTADVKVFPNIQPDSDGQLHIAFSGENGQQALLSAIEILPGMRGHIRPVRLLARQTPYYSNDSHWWSPDNYFEGGQLATYTTPVNGTDDPELYETERWGNFSYAIPVSPGKYTVSLLFAVRHGNWDQQSSQSDANHAALAHIFNVYCNGSVLLQNFDLAKEAGSSDVVLRKATGLEPNAQGKLILTFVPVEGYATVTGIEVLPE